MLNRLVPVRMPIYAPEPPFGSAPGMPAAFALIANSAEAGPTHVFRFIEISPVLKSFYRKAWCITGYLLTIEFRVIGAVAP